MDIWLTGIGLPYEIDQIPVGVILSVMHGHSKKISSKPWLQIQPA